jgi:hypothetical protein
VKTICTMPPEGWVPISNATARSRKLSWRAKGLLLDFLSHKDGYVITFDRLMAMAKAEGDPDVEGPHAMRRALQELERKGYIVRLRHNYLDEETGRARWRTETLASDDPTAPALRDAEIPTPGGSVLRTVRDSEDPHVIKNTGFHKTGEEDGLAKHDATFAAAHVGQQASRDLPNRVGALYEQANELDDDQVRRHLLAFEKKRKRIYRDCRNKAIDQLGREDPDTLEAPDGHRYVDLLSFKYALQHYGRDPEVQLPMWLTTFPRTRAQRSSVGSVRSAS